MCFSFVVPFRCCWRLLHTIGLSTRVWVSAIAQCILLQIHGCLRHITSVWCVLDTTCTSDVVACHFDTSCDLCANHVFSARIGVHHMHVHVIVWWTFMARIVYYCPGIRRHHRVLATCYFIDAVCDNDTWSTIFETLLLVAEITFKSLSISFIVNSFGILWRHCFIA